MKLAFLLASMPLLCEEANENPSAGGAPVADPPKGEDEKLTIGQRLSAAIASKATLQATIAEQTATTERLTQELATATTALAAANARIATLEADATAIETALAAAEAEAAAEKAKNTTVEKKAQEKVASLGFPAAKLPAAEDKNVTDDLPASAKELDEQLAKLSTHREKSALIRRYEAARAQGSK